MSLKYDTNTQTNCLTNRYTEKSTNKQTRIVGFPQSVNGRKDENPTRKTCREYFKAYGWQK